MKHPSNRMKIALRIETVRILAAAQLTDVGGGATSPCPNTQPKYTTWCSAQLCA